MKVAICVCTYQRPTGLANLLDHIARLNTAHEVAVYVADNDSGAQAGMTVVESRVPSFRWPLRAEIVSQRGISHARNAVAAMALADHPELVAFLDDDEWPTPMWLTELIRVLQQHAADAVGGPTRSVFPADEKAAAPPGHYYGADLGVPDGSPCQLEAAGNFLIRASTLHSLGPQFFHPDFALSGGEDLAFFLRLRQAGCRMYWAADAVVNENVPPERLTRHWLRQRVILIANSRVHVMRMFEPGPGAALLRGIKTVGLAIAAGLLSVAGLISTPLAQRARLLRWKCWGKLTAHLNQRPVRAEGH